MKILSVKQIREADQYTILNEPIKSIDLMERAAFKSYQWIIEKFDNTYQFNIFCGLGNNGGDGLVIARLLSENGFLVNVFKVMHSNNFSDEFLENDKRFSKLYPKNISIIKKIGDIKPIDISKKNIIIDAILGSGLSKPISGIIEDTVKWINHQSCLVISIDIPTGLFSDDNSDNNLKAITKADFTLTFQFPKLAFMFPENEEFVGNLEVLDIGLHPNFLKDVKTNSFFIESNDLQAFFKYRKKYSHKGSYGHALLLAGSYGKIGAAILASKSCLKSGSGLITVHLPECGYQIIQTSFPEAMVSVDKNENFISEIPDISKYDSIAIGPGIGTEEETQKAFKLLIQSSKIPLIIDADAINILSENQTWLSFLPSNSILTPHPKEFERLVGKSSNSMEKMKLAKDFSSKFQVFIILKGANSMIVSPNGNYYFNSTGNPGMATGGSGDVLTGILLGLMSQGYSPFETCLIGVYLHGFAGDLALKTNTVETLIASNITRNLNKAFRETFY
ncbi:MAG: NAD(P)H-hydrate dehydratase [Bacteroidetes bacterium]|nr:NAD(P)H-hydrate dehydratase [Bacteroidota bacterium]